MIYISYHALPLTEDKVYFIAEVMSEESNVSILHTIIYSFDEWVSVFNESENDKDEESFVVYNNDIPCAWLKLNGLLNADTAWISMLVVSDKYKHQGVGKFAVEYAFEYLYSKGFNQIGVQTTKDNVAAINLYKKCGFNIVELKKFKTDKSVFYLSKIIILRIIAKTMVRRIIIKSYC